jgi:hypothetical protein
MGRRGITGIVVAVAVLSALVAGSATASADPPRPVATEPASASDPSATRAAVDDLEDRFLSTRPSVGPTWIVDLNGTSDMQRVTLRTLQGVVNRTQARLYLQSPGDPGSQRWIDDYTARGLVTFVGTTDMAGAIDRFAAEATGYVLVSEAEPWTIDVGATMAAAERVIVATPADEAALQAEGLALKADLRGQWTDAPTAYEWADATYRAQLASPSVAVLRESDSMFDFATQQGMLTLFTRPADPSWPRMRAIIEKTPADHAVYGYLSDTGDEEVVAVATLASAGLFLVPTDTTKNLSFHVAVGAAAARTKVALPPDPASVAPCDANTVNVVVGITDGDNLNVPITRFSETQNWRSPARGQLPLAWSIGPDLAILAPSIWDAYALEATPDDELVGMIGYAYSAPALLPDPDEFYRSSFALMNQLGMTTFWSLGGGLDAAASANWSVFDAAADAGGPVGSGTPNGVLVGYGNGIGSQFWSPAGRPAFTSRTVYGENSDQMVDHIHALQATSPADRPLVSFLSATNWTNPAQSLITKLVPLEAEGVRFLTPAEATACLPPAPPPVPPSTEGGLCVTSGPSTQHGLSLISGPAASEVEHTPTSFPPVITARATPTVDGGATIDYTATVTIDAPALAASTLADRIRPIIEAGYGKPLADTAWASFTFRQLGLVVPVPPSASAIGVPVATSDGPGVTATWGSGGLLLLVAPFTEDTRAPGAPFTITARWSVKAPPATTMLELIAGPMTFDLDLTIGLVLGGTTPLQGGVRAPWTCGTTNAVLATTEVRGAPPLTFPAAPVAVPVLAQPSLTG